MHPASHPPRASAILCLAARIADALAEPGQTGGPLMRVQIRGVLLGLALGQLDPAWAEAACRELIELHGGRSGTSDTAPAEQRMVYRRIAQGIIRASEGFARGSDDQGDAPREP